MPSPWNDTTDRQLLLIMIELAAPTLPKWDQVAQHMGEGFTAESTRQHFQKMRREIKEQIGDVSGTSNGKGKPSTPATPKKSKTKTNGTPASKKRKIKASSDDEEIKEENTMVENEEDDGVNPFT